jgi:glutamyl-tRNA reductase
MGLNLHLTPRLLQVGVDFRIAPVAVRERWTLDDGALDRLHREAAAREIPELVVLRTCNRTEFTAFGPDPAHGPDLLFDLWRLALRRPTGERPVPAAIRTGPEAARHLLRVAAGLESQILGDIHILGQLRRDYRDALRRSSVGPSLHRLFDAALRAGKRVRKETALMAGRPSVGSEAAAFLARCLPPGAPRRIVVVGAGKIGSAAARTAATLPGMEVVLLNRTPERARLLAGEWGGRWGTLEDLGEILPEAGGLLVATSAPGPWVDAEVLARRPSGRPFPVVDVSLPRNVDPGVERLTGIALVDLDRLHPDAARVEEARRESVPEAEAVLEEELRSYAAWMADSEIRDALRPLHELVMDICRREIRHAVDAGSDPGSAADRAARRIAAKLLARPMTALRTLPAGRTSGSVERELLSHAARRLFEADLATSGRDPLPLERRS